MKVLIIVPSGYDHYFTLDNKGKLIHSTGYAHKRSLGIFDPIKEKNIVKSASTELSESEILEFTEVLDEFKVRMVDRPMDMIFSSWDIFIWYQGKEYQVSYWDNEFYELTNLLQELDKKSPTEIDIYGW